MLSVNQVNAQIKLTEMWKGVQTKDYPVNIKESIKPDGAMETRSSGTHHLVQHRKSELSCRTFINDATRVWNLASLEARKSESLFSAKKAIKKFVKTLPI